MRTAHASTCVGTATSRGFTLVELMITIVVAAVLITIAVPSFQHIMATSNLSSTTNNLVGAMRLARMTAIKSNAEVQFCSNSAAENTNSTLGTACGTQTGAVYVLSGDGTAVQVRAPINVADGQQGLHGNVVALVYTPQGFAKEAGATGTFSDTVATVCSSALDSDNYRVIELVGGAVVDTSTNQGACP